MAASGTGSPAKESAKIHNNRTTFVLGHDKADWSTDAKDAFAWRRDPAATDDRELAKTLAAKQRVTSVALGSEMPDYHTDYGDAFVSSPGAIAAAKPPKMGRDLRCTNFSLGDARGTFETDYSAAFNHATPTVMDTKAERSRAKVVREELRRTHFSLGEAAADWSTTGSAAQTTGCIVDPAERARKKADLDEFRRELGRLHFSLGSEAATDYTTTTAMPAVDTMAAHVPRVRKNMHRTNFVLGDEATDYRSQSMSMSGQESMKLDDPYMPHRDGSWKHDMSKIKGRKPPL